MWYYTYQLIGGGDDVCDLSTVNGEDELTGLVLCVTANCCACRKNCHILNIYIACLVSTRY